MPIAPFPRTDGPTILSIAASLRRASSACRPARLQSLLAALLGGLSLGVAAAAPFDTAEVSNPRASFIDVAQRSKLLREPADPTLRASLPKATDCAAEPALEAPRGAMVIPPRYASGNHGPLHPDYEATVKLYRDFESISATLANQYVASGEPRFAQCLLDHLERWAKADALLGYEISTAKGASNQAWYQAEWSASAAALALSQVVAEPSLDQARLKAVIDWLHRVSKKQISYPGGENTCCNNHAYWRGLHATMIGVLANDNDLFRWGLGRYALAIEHMAADGSWPLEMARHEQALHYQNYALLPLVMIAEIAAQQGVDLYAHKVDGRDLHLAIDFLRKTLAAHQANPPSDGKKMDLRAFVAGRGDQAWAEFYRARFAKDPLGLLGKRIFNARTGGHVTMLVYRPAGDAGTRP
ncbi:alginate lyase family protein [Piscinibacter sakaiensis]|uniref:alginate lyase family protein n=1 Tax=Piscinibacter sakaiensis TaxID=1547922 RepID=UPI003AB04A9C